MRDTITSPRVLDMKRKLRLYRVRLSILCFILFVVLVGALGYFSSYPAITIRTIVITGTRTINSTNVESRVKDDLLGKYIRLFTRANTAIYPRKKIYNDLLVQFPRIDKLEVYRDNPTTLHIAITERSGSYLYCGADVPEVQTDVGENCYFVNNDGYVFDKAPYFSGNVYFKYYMTIPSGVTSDPLRSQILPPDKFHQLAQFIDGVTALGFKPIYVVVDQTGNASLVLSHGSASTIPKILFKNDETMPTVLTNLSASMAKKEFAGEINSKYTTLLYIDLRFDNKVVYKFQ